MWTPLKFRFSFLAKKYIVKTFSNLNHTLTEKLDDLWNSTHQNNPHRITDIFTLLVAFDKTRKLIPQIRRTAHHPLFEFPYSDHTFSPQINVEIGFLSQNSPDLPSFFQNAVENFNDFLIFYTDGSKSQDGKSAGCASVCPSGQLTYSWKINYLASIFSIEAIAILLTLDYILKHNFKKVVIFTDSLSVLESVSSTNPNTIKSYLIFLIRNRLATLSALNCNIILAWVPGHRGISGNELADKAAKFASTNAPLLNIGLPPSDFVGSFREHLNSITQNYCKTRGKRFGVFYTEHFYKPRRKPWFANFITKREWIVSLCRMRSNHHSLRASLARKNIIDSPSCPCDPQIEEDLDHVLWNCPRFNAFRPSLLKGLSKALKCAPPFHSNQLLANPSIRIISHVFRFLKKANLKV